MAKQAQVIDQIQVGHSAPKESIAIFEVSGRSLLKERSNVCKGVGRGDGICGIVGVCAGIGVAKGAPNGEGVCMREFGRGVNGAGEN